MITEAIHRAICRVLLSQHPGSGEVRALRDCRAATPEAFLDHRDLYRLSSNLSSVLDEIKAAADCIDLFRVPESITQMMGMVEMLARATELTSQAARDLRNVNTRIDSIHEYVTNMEALKDAADRQHRQTRATLYEGDFNVMAVLRYRDILKSIEGAIDRLEVFAKTIDRIAIRSVSEVS